MASECNAASVLAARHQNAVLDVEPLHAVQIAAIYTSDFRGERGILGPVVPHSGMPIDNLQFAG